MRSRWILAVTLIVVTAPAASVRAQTEEQAPATDETPPAETVDDGMAHIEYGFRRLREAGAADRARLEALEARIAAGGGGAAPAAAGADTEALRAEIAALRTELEDLRADTEDVQQGVDDSAAELASRLTLSGYASVYLDVQKGKNAHFRAFRTNLFGNGQITENFRYFMEIEFEDAAGTGEGAGYVIVEQAFMEFKLAAAIGIRAGVQLAPFGYFNRYHEDWRNPFTQRPLVNNYVFPSTYTDTGISLYGVLVDTPKLQLEYTVGVFNGLDAEISTEAAGGQGMRGARPVFASDNNSDKSFVGRVALIVGDALTVGVSGYWGPYQDDGGAAIEMVGADLLMTVGGLRLRAEGALVNIEKGFLLYDDDQDPTTPSIEDPYPTTLAGGVLELEYDAFPAFLKETVLGRFEDPHLFFAARVDFITTVFASGARPTELLVGGSVGYRPVHRSAIRVEFQHGVATSDGGIGLKDDWQFILAFAMGY